MTAHGCRGRSADQKAITWVIEAMGESPNQATMEDLQCLREQVKEHVRRR